MPGFMQSLTRNQVSYLCQVGFLQSIQYKTKLHMKCVLLPPAYAVQQEGTVLSGVCLDAHGGRGYPISIP